MPFEAIVLYGRTSRNRKSPQIRLAVDRARRGGAGGGARGGLDGGGGRAGAKFENAEHQFADPKRNFEFAGVFADERFPFRHRFHAVIRNRAQKFANNRLIEGIWLAPPMNRA